MGRRRHRVRAQPGRTSNRVPAANRSSRARQGRRHGLGRRRSEGFNGGSEFVRHVVDSADESAAVDFFTAHCDRVRVMPFLDGIPTSIHGLVFPDGVAVFRPVEMVILRRPPDGPSGFVVGGLSTWWDPPPADREMRASARRVGNYLRDAVDYRGGFSLDGILTRDGFRPTEVNPRFSSGLVTLVRSLPDLPLIAIQCALVSGADPGVTADELEGLVVSAADKRRYGAAATLTTAVHPRETDARRVVLDGQRYRVARDGEADHGTLSLGPSAVGGLVRLDPDPRSFPHVSCAVRGGRLRAGGRDLGYGNRPGAPRSFAALTQPRLTRL